MSPREDGAVRNDAALARRIDAVIDRAIAEHRIVGAVLVVLRDGETVYRRATGFADREARTPMLADTIHRLASITKPIVSAAALALSEVGRLGLDDIVSDWLPDFRPCLPDGRQPDITIRQLLTHTAGLRYGHEEPPGGPFERAGVSDGLEQPGLSMQEELRRLASVPLLFEPGTAWTYSTAIDVLGEILARAHGSALPDVVELLVTGPLGMADTRFFATDPARLAVPYADASLEPVRMGDPHVIPIEGAVGRRYSPSRIFDFASFPSGGAGMAGTTGEVALLLETIRTGGGPILSPETARAMMSNQIGDLRVTTRPTPAWGFGFGGAVLLDPTLAASPLSDGTWQWGGVYGHYWFVDPVRRLTVVSLTNTAVEGMGGRYPADITAAICG
jgi:CubicO group peptidase (beta-lactamase class C family)